MLDITCRDNNLAAGSGEFNAFFFFLNKVIEEL